MGEVLHDAEQIALLRDTPWVEVDVFIPTNQASEINDDFASHGLVKAGPASKNGYIVSEGTHALKRQLYVLRLTGNSSAYLCRPEEVRSLYKIGLSVSPDLRRRAFEKSMPRGAFHWCIDRTSTNSGLEFCNSFNAAVAGEDAMKKYLAEFAEWLGGEFYLATKSEIEVAWKLGNAAAQSYVASD